MNLAIANIILAKYPLIKITVVHLSVPMQLSDGRPYVGVTVCCSQVGSAIKPFKSLASSIEWVLNSLPGGWSQA